MSSSFIKTIVLNHCPGVQYTPKSDLPVPTPLDDLHAKVRAGENVVEVDNTSLDAVARLYPKFLNAGVNVITPNKKVFSVDLGLFLDITSSSTSSESYQCLRYKVTKSKRQDRTATSDIKQTIFRAC